MYLSNFINFVFSEKLMLPENNTNNVKSIFKILLGTLHNISIVYYSYHISLAKKFRFKSILFRLDENNKIRWSDSDNE